MKKIYNTTLTYKVTVCYIFIVHKIHKKKIKTFYVQKLQDFLYKVTNFILNIYKS